MNFDEMTAEQLKEQLSLQIQLVQRQSTELGNLTTQNISLGLTLDLKNKHIQELEEEIKQPKKQGK